MIRKILDKQQKLNLMKDISNIFEVCSLRSVVSEFTFLDKFNPIAIFLKQLFTQKRKLGQKQVNVPKAETNQISKIKIRINIDHGRNIPVRSDTEKIIKKQQQRYMDMKQLHKFQSSQYDDDDLNFVNSLIQLQLFSENQETSSVLSLCQKGPNPVWNQSLDLELKSKTDNFSYLEVVNESNRLVITLFDNTVRNTQSNSNRLITNTKKKYLGCISIPVLNLLQKNKITGVIKIQRPIILLGYLTIDQSGYSINNEQLKEYCNPLSGTYLTVNIYNGNLKKKSNVCLLQQISKMSKIYEFQIKFVKQNY